MAQAHTAHKYSQIGTYCGNIRVQLPEYTGVDTTLLCCRQTGRFTM